MADITVVVPVRDDLRITRCLRSFDCDGARPLVVLNDATEPVRRAVAQAGVDTLDLPDAGGPAACERGIEAAGTRHVLMMDSDCVFLPGTLAAFKRAVGSADLVRGVTLFRHHTSSERLVSKVRARHTNSPHMVFKVPLLIDRRVRDRIGGYVFDDRLAWTEDFDLTVRAKKAGLGVRRLRDAVVLHDALSIRRDLVSSFRYGQGHRQGVSLHLEGYRPVSRRGALRGLMPTAKRYGFRDALYGLASNISFAAGYARATSGMEEHHPQSQKEARE